MGAYELYVYDVADYNVGTGRPGVVSLAASDGGATASFNGNGNLSTWVEGANYVLLSATASSAGSISFNISPSGGNHEIDPNGFHLVSLASVPERSSLAMGTIALAPGSGTIAMRRQGRSRRRSR